MIRTMNTLYANTTAQIKIEGFFLLLLVTPKVLISGVPFPYYCLSLAVESLAEVNSQTTAIKEIKIGETEHKITFCADYMVVYMTFPEASLEVIQKLLFEYDTVSRLKINHKKSEILQVYLSPTILRYLKHKFLFQLVTKSWSYL